MTLMRYPRKKLAQKAAHDELERETITAPPVPIERIARAHGLTIRYETTDGENISGALYVGVGSGVIGVNDSHHENRQRFTVAHELGHFLLHARAKAPNAVFLDQKFTWNRDTESELATNPEEIEANQFAAEILVPLAMLKADIESGDYDVEVDDDLRRLAKRYKVSLQTLTFRLQALTAFGE